jgi:gliding motility-associated-like protein
VKGANIHKVITLWLVLISSINAYCGDTNPSILVSIQEVNTIIPDKQNVSNSIKKRIELRVKPNPFTPNADGIHDSVKFDFKGDLDENIRIFDLRGKLVRTLQDSIRYWDGKDDAGNLVKGGGYIYQIKVQDTVVNGVVVVIR